MALATAFQKEKVNRKNATSHSFPSFWLEFDLVMLTIPDLTSRVESSQQVTKPESSRVEESTPE